MLAHIAADAAVTTGSARAAAVSGVVGGCRTSVSTVPTSASGATCAAAPIGFPAYHLAARPAGTASPAGTPIASIDTFDAVGTDAAGSPRTAHASVASDSASLIGAPAFTCRAAGTTGAPDNLAVVDCSADSFAAHASGAAVPSVSADPVKTGWTACSASTASASCTGGVIHADSALRAAAAVAAVSTYAARRPPGASVAPHTADPAVVVAGQSSGTSCPAIAAEATSRK